MIGTVFSLEPLRPHVTALGLPPSALEGWFAAALRDAFALAATGDFKPLPAVLEGALDQVLAEQKLNPNRSARAALVNRMDTLAPREDARAAFEALARARIRIVALTNGGKATTRHLLEKAGLERLVERIVSVDEVGLFKPRREVYERVAQLCKVKPKRVALVAAHPWDIQGAKAAGLRAAFVRIERSFPASMRAPDVEAGSLTEAAHALIAL